jgi:hypothetical protein
MGPQRVPVAPRIPDLPSPPSAGCIIAAVQDVAVCGMHAVDSSRSVAAGQACDADPASSRCRSALPTATKGTAGKPDGAASPGNSVSALALRVKRAEAEADAPRERAVVIRQAYRYPAQMQTDVAQLTPRVLRPAACALYRSSHLPFRQVADPCVALAHTWPCQ